MYFYSIRQNYFLFVKMEFIGDEGEQMCLQLPRVISSSTEEFLNNRIQ